MLLVPLGGRSGVILAVGSFGVLEMWSEISGRVMARFGVEEILSLLTREGWILVCTIFGFAGDSILILDNSRSSCRSYIFWL